MILVTNPYLDNYLQNVPKDLTGQSNKYFRHPLLNTITSSIQHARFNIQHQTRDSKTIISDCVSHRYKPQHKTDCLSSGIVSERQFAGYSWIYEHGFLLDNDSLVPAIVGFQTPIMRIC